jgi:hypothetical protein
MMRLDIDGDALGRQGQTGQGQTGLEKGAGRLSHDQASI